MAFTLVRRADTGWLDVSALLLNGWTGAVYLRRSGALVEIRFGSISAAVATAGALLTIPAGFKPTTLAGSYERFTVHRADSGPTIRRGSLFAGNATVVGYQAADVLEGSILYLTSEAMPSPSSYPGVKV